MCIGTPPEKLFSAPLRRGTAPVHKRHFLLGFTLKIVEIYAENCGNLCQVAPITNEFCRDFDGTNVGDRQHDRAAFVRQAERQRARRRKRPLLQIASSDNRRGSGRPNAMPVCGVSRPMVCALCVSEPVPRACLAGTPERLMAP